jgi:6-phosphogluconolactonase
MPRVALSSAVMIKSNLATSVLIQAFSVGLCLALAISVGRADESMLVYIGTLGSRPLGPAPTAAQASSVNGAPPDDRRQGIYAARLDANTGHLSLLGHNIELERATWLLAHPTLPVIYSVAEGKETGDDSDIYALAVERTTGQLRIINMVSAGGRDATQLALDAPSRTLFSANHGSGDVTSLPIQADGSLGSVASKQKDYGTGPHPRQKSPTAHGVAVDPSHRDVLVADFAADRIFVYHFDPATRSLTPSLTPFEALPAGSGPRHLVFHPNNRFLYVATELTGEIHVFDWEPKKARLHPVQMISAYPQGFSGEKSAAEIAVSRDGRHCYLSLRGDQNLIVAYAVEESSGALEEIQRISPQGKTPWSFGIDPSGRWMLVANEGSSTVTELQIDPTSGELSATDESLPIPKPVTVTFFPP